jgi:hypothetical protein
MIYCNAQARRDCFLSGESSNVCINHSFRWNILVGSKPFWLCSVHNGDLSPTRPARSRSRFGLHSGPQLTRSHLSCNCRRVRACCITKGLGSYYRRGSDCATRPPRDDSLTFRNRSESWCAGLGQEYLRRKDVPKGGLRQLAETQVQ